MSRTDLDLDLDLLRRVADAYSGLIVACDQGRQFSRGVGGMTIEAQIKGTVINGVPAWPVEEAREPLDELRALIARLDEPQDRAAGVTGPITIGRWTIQRLAADGAVDIGPGLIAASDLFKADPYAPAPQAVDAETAGLVERLTKIADACRRDDGTDIPLGMEIRAATTALLALSAQRSAAEAARDEAVRIATEGFEIIAGKRQCLDNLMGNRDVAEAALRLIAALKAGEPSHD